MSIVGGKAIRTGVSIIGNDSVQFIRKLNYTNKSSPITDLISFGYVDREPGD